MAYQYYGQPPWTQPRAPTYTAPHIHAPAWAPSQNQAQAWAPSHNQAPTWAPSHNQAPPRVPSHAPAPTWEPPTNPGPTWAHPINPQPQSHIPPFIPPKPQRRRSSVSEPHAGEGNPGRNFDAPGHGHRGRSQTSQPEPSVEQLVPAFARLGPSDPLLSSEPYNRMY